MKRKTILYSNRNRNKYGYRYRKARKKKIRNNDSRSKIFVKKSVVLLRTSCAMASEALSGVRKTTSALFFRAEMWSMSP